MNLFESIKTITPPSRDYAEKFSFNLAVWVRENKNLTPRFCWPAGGPGGGKGRFRRSWQPILCRCGWSPGAQHDLPGHVFAPSMTSQVMRTDGGGLGRGRGASGRPCPFGSVRAGELGRCGWSLGSYRPAPRRDRAASSGRGGPWQAPPEGVQPVRSGPICAKGRQILCPSKPFYAFG